MDNAAFHKKEILHGITKEYSQTLIFLPLYSPKHNLIEHVNALKRNIAAKLRQYSFVAETLDVIL